MTKMTTESRLSSYCNLTRRRASSVDCLSVSSSTSRRRT